MFCLSSLSSLSSKTHPLCTRLPPNPIKRPQYVRANPLRHLPPLAVTAPHLHHPTLGMRKSRLSHLLAANPPLPHFLVLFYFLLSVRAVSIKTSHSELQPTTFATPPFLHTHTVPVYEILCSCQPTPCTMSASINSSSPSPLQPPLRTSPPPARTTSPLTRVQTPLVNLSFLLNASSCHWWNPTFQPFLTFSSP